MSNTARIFKVSIFVTALLAGVDAFAAQAPNPRSGGAAVSRTDGARGSAASVSGVSASRAARRPTTAGRAVMPVVAAPKVDGANISARGATASRAATTRAASLPHATSARAASSSVMRSATSAKSARSATPTANVSRAASARATAVFEDVSAIGGGYAACRDAYAACMDQFCAKANDTYRRCFCSSKFEVFRDTEIALDQAKTLLMQFEDNNLNAVDKSAAEVDAMYSATVGEAAIKKDTSASAKVLNEIGDLLSGKKKAADNNNTTGLGLISVDFSADIDDVWNGGGSSIFDTSSDTDLSLLEGQSLYNSANSQCEKLVTESCENNAVLTMSRSSYNILISQDCNAYEKKINSQRESVKQTVRQAEKMLRDARLEEYRTHNSADVNECLDKVRTAITQDTACGANYKKCLDYSGVYIDTNGEPRYSPRLFELANQIKLSGGADVLGDSDNTNFNNFLDSKKMFATTALNSCRDLADTVWTEFKRSALIEIAQAQDAKIEEVKMSCVSTMAECYDTQSGALKDMDTNTAKYSGAVAANAARYMCRDKVAACASLYGGTVECKFDGSSGKPINANECGLGALFKFVDTVDYVRIAEGCQTALENKLKEDCTPTEGDMGYPWKCRLSDDLETLVEGYAQTYCSTGESGEKLTYDGNDVIRKVVDNLREELVYQLEGYCDNLDGYWIDARYEDYEGADVANAKVLKAFYDKAFNGNQKTLVGKCLENTTKLTCENYNEVGKDAVAVYDAARDVCNFTEEWYSIRCSLLGNGYYENGVCYVTPSN